MYVLQPDLLQEKLDDLVNKFQQVVIQNGGTINQLQEIGKRRLAYEIAGVHEGYYVLMMYSGSTGIAGELERVFKISENVLRYLTVRAH
ncbi:MAG: 30S ribosomal protein S6 [Tumebacillaceae bacterium]